MTIELEPFGRSHSKVLEIMNAEVPKGDFYPPVDRAISVPYTRTGFEFILTVSSSAISEVVTFRVGTNAAERPDGFESSFAVIPGSTSSIVKIKLGKGLNYVSVKNTTDGEKRFLVASSMMGLIHEAIALDIYDKVIRPLDEHETEIMNPLSSRLLSWILPFQDLLPDVQMPRTIATRIIMRALMHDTSSEKGVLDFFSGFGANTPIIEKQSSDSDRVEPITGPIFKSGQDLGGHDTHLWLPNQCSDRWYTFAAIINNIREVFRLEKITEDEIVYRLNLDFILGTGFSDDAVTDQQSHRALFDDPMCSMYGMVSFNCLEVLAWFQASWTTQGFFCVAQYPFDVVVDECGTLGSSHFDCSVLPEQTFDTTEVTDASENLADYGLTGSQSYDVLPISADYTTLVGAGVDNFKTTAVPIGFPFVLDGVTYLSMYLSSNGYLELTNNLTEPGASDNGEFFTGANAVLAPWWNDLKTSDTIGYIRYAQRGWSPERYVIIEWKCYKDSGEVLGTNTELVFQVVLYETGKVEFRYATEVIRGAPGAETNGASIGVRSPTEYREFTTDTDSTVVTTLTVSVDWPGPTGGFEFLPEQDTTSAPPFDSQDAEDPTGDGWLGFILSGLDGEGCFDSSLGYLEPSHKDIEDCCRGFAVTPLMLQFAEPTALDGGGETHLNFGHIDVPGALVGPGVWMV